MHLFASCCMLLGITTISRSVAWSGGNLMPNEKDFQINYKPKKIHVNMTHHTLAEEWMIDRMTEIQKVVVTVRKKLLKKIMLAAWFVAHNVEQTMPDFYFCTVGAYNNIIRRDFFKYPNGLITEVRNVKEALFTSLVTKTPIAKLDHRVAKNLNFYLNDLSQTLEDHGKAVYVLSETLVDYQENEMNEACQMPPGPRMNDDNATTIDYSGDEDYEPVQYLGF